MRTTHIQFNQSTHLKYYACMLMLILFVLISGCSQTRNRDILEAFTEEGIKGEWWSKVLTTEIEVFTEGEDEEEHAPQPIKYGDRGLQEAEEILTGVYPRPWTEKLVIQWFRNSKSEKHKIALLRILSVTGSGKAAWQNGQVLESGKNINTRTRLYFAAMDNIDRYFVPHDGQPQDINASIIGQGVLDWWRLNKSKLQEYADD